MTPEKQNAISLFCYVAVSGLFATFHNPKMRGSEFTWDKFPEMMERHCRTMYPIQTGDFLDKEAEVAHAARTGREIAEHLVDLMRNP